MQNLSNIQELFLAGMKREIPQLALPPCGGVRVQLGCGIHKLDGFVNLDLPDYNGSFDRIPCEDESVAEVRAFHVLEHLDDPIFCLGEIQRVLKPGGIANLVTPHWSSDIAYTDMTHRQYWGEKVWRNLFKNAHYSPPNHNEWKFHIHLNIILGVTHRNLAMLTQLIRL